jgi:hypothetical protein
MLNVTGRSGAQFDGVFTEVGDHPQVAPECGHVRLADEIELNQSSGRMASLPQPPRALTGVRPEGLSSYHRSDIGMGEPASSSRPVGSVVVAGVGELRDSSNVLLSPCHALHLLEHLLALTRRRGEE